MKSRFGHIRGHRARSLVFAATLLISQVLVQAHGLQFGFGEHSHNGVQCTVAILQEDLDDVEPGGSSLNLDRPPEALSGSSPQEFALPNSCVLLPSTRGPPAPVLAA
jgi:hypothetical protein